MVVNSDIGKMNYDKWNKNYKIILRGRKCFEEESLWRRTQEKCNKEFSGWKTEEDKRRRMVHYKHSFDVIKKGKYFNFCLVKTYLWIHLYLPEFEIKEYEDNIKLLLDSSPYWKKSKIKKTAVVYQCGDLIFKMKTIKKHIYDIKEKREFPKNYKILEIIACSKNFKSNYYFLRKPWLVLKSGIRKKDKRGNPIITRNPSDILKYLPAQVEIGGGASIEAGVCPLHFLHSVYNVSEKSKKFVFSWKKDDVVRNMINNPEKTLKTFSIMYGKIFKTEPNLFYRNLKFLHKSGYFVGPVITNNFDGLLRQAGISEIYVRKYSDNNNPNIKFNRKAKSLIVIGSHADRRSVQKKARLRGLKVIYIDTEGFYGDKGKLAIYPLESAQDNDIILKLKADDALKGIISNLNH